MSDLSAHDKAVLNCVFNPSLPITPLEEPETLEDEVIGSPEAKQLEIEAVNLAESGDLEQALNLLNKCIESSPSVASLYNNRALVYQYQKKYIDAFDDLTKAIWLADSVKQRKTKSQAYCQRGLLHRRNSRLDLARDDFRAAAQLGNQFAKSQLVEVNPYAALCNEMLRKVMDKM